MSAHSDPDWWARVLGGLGFGLSLVNLGFSRTDSRWRRTHVAGTTVQAAFKTLAPVAVPNPDDKHLINFLSITGGSALETIREDGDKMPGPILRYRLRRFHDALAGVRGTIDSQKVADGTYVLSAMQRKKIATAARLRSKIEQTFLKASRRGVA